MRTHPPKIANWILSAFMAADHQAIIGDMVEEFEDNCEQNGRFSASFRFWLQTLQLVPSMLIMQIIWSHIMLKNYLVIAWRNIRKHKAFSAINIIGLAIGMPVCLLVIIIVHQQRQMDRFHHAPEDIYRVITNAADKTIGYRNDVASTPGKLLPALRDQYSGIETGVQLSSFYGNALIDNQPIALRGFYTDAAFFELFNFPLEKGAANTALTTPYSAIISREAAQRLFPDAPAYGNTLTFSFGEVKITGILADLPDGEWSHLAADILVSQATIAALGARGYRVPDANDWQYHSTFYTYLRLAPQTSPDEIEKHLAAINQANLRESDRFVYHFSLQALQDIPFGLELVNKVGRVMENFALYLFLIIGTIVMLPAVFNYISLTVARSLKRAKEIGIRKVTGAKRSQIIVQFFVESMIMALLSLLPATLILYWLLPYFNQFDFAEYVVIDWTTDYSIYLFFIGFALLVGLLAGLIPAFSISSMKPVSILRGISKIKGFSALPLRKVLLVIQFTLAIFFMTITNLVYQQVQFMMNADYGFNMQNVLSVDLQDTSYDRFREALLSHSGIESVSATSAMIGRVYAFPDFPVRLATSPDPQKMVRFSIDNYYLDDFGYVFLAGRNFSDAFGSDTASAVIINETAARRLGFTQPGDAIGQALLFGENQEKRIIGVLKDFHYSRLHTTIAPVLLEWQPADLGKVMVRIQPGNLPERRHAIASAWGKTSAEGRLLNYQFLDDFVLGAYNDSRDIATFLAIISGLAIFISCLGLLGMVIYNAETRMKEIGIRKVLGASIGKLVMLLSRDFIILLTIAIVIASSLASLFIANVFMAQFTYRISLGPLLFLSGISIVVILAVSTIAFQTLRAAATNPVAVLRNE